MRPCKNVKINNMYTIYKVQRTKITNNIRVYYYDICAGIGDGACGVK